MISPGDLPPRVPVVVAALIVGLDLAKTILLWTFSDAWSHAAEAVALSSTAFSALLTIGIAIGVLAATRTLSLVDLGFTRRRLCEALVVAAVLCLAYAIGAYATEPSPAPMPLADAIPAAYSEELVLRMVAVGGILAASHQLARRRALVVAFLGSLVLFVFSHVPHDIVETPPDLVGRYIGLFGSGALVTAIYLYSHNLALVTVLHALGNSPVGIGFGETSWTINGAVSVAVLITYAVASRRATAVRATQRARSRPSLPAPSDTPGESPSSRAS